MRKISYLLFFLIFVITLALYWSSFSIFFTGDDFFHFKASLTDGSLLGFVKLFGFYPFTVRGYAFYRPLFREALYNLVYGIWGLNQIPLRIFAIILHFSNVVLVYFFVRRLFKSERIAFLTAFLFSIAAANVGAIYYLAGGLQAQGAALFVLLTLLAFPKHKILAFVSFILALMSHELAVVTPFLLIGYSILSKDFKIKHVLPYFVAVAFYLYLDIKFIGFSASEAQYQPTVNPKISINSLFWYSLWSLGLPETLIDYVNPGFRLNPDLLKYYGDYYKFIFPAFFVSLAAIVSLVLLKIKTVLKEREILFLFFWFVVGIAPVLFLPLHRSTYYLTLSLPAFYTVISFLLFGKSRIVNLISVIFLVSFSILTIYSVKVMDITYWAAQRGRLSERLIEDIKNKYPSLPKGSGLLIKNDPNYPFISRDWGGTSKQANLILSGSDALQLLYEDNSLKVYYQDLGGVPESASKANIFEFTAKIN